MSSQSDRPAVPFTAPERELLRREPCRHFGEDPQRLPTASSCAQSFPPFSWSLSHQRGRVPKSDEIDQIFLLTRVMYKAALGLHYKRKEQKEQGQLAIF